MDGIDEDLMDQIFDFMVRDFSKYALNLFSHPSSSREQMDICLGMLQKPANDQERFGRVWQKHVYTLKDTYTMNP